MKVSTEEQINILDHVKDVYLTRGISNFICNGITFRVGYKITNPVPSFNFTNVTKICKENGLTLPVKYHKNGGGWWHIDDIEVRKQVLTILIENLKKK